MVLNKPESLDPAVPQTQGGAPVKYRAPMVDGIRGWAAVGVLVTHTAYVAAITAVDEKHPGWPVVRWFVEGLTVTLAPFFLLSGMLLYRAFARSTFAGTPFPSLKAFFVRRSLRIIPTYWVIVTWVMLTINLDGGHGFWWFLRPYLLLQYFDTDNGNYYYPGLEITWSVAVEYIFYLLLPLMALGAGAYAKRSRDAGQQLQRICVALSPFVVLGLLWEAYTHMDRVGDYPAKAYWPPNFFGVLAVGMMVGAALAYQDVTGRKVGLLEFAARRPMYWWGAAFAVYILNCWSAAGDGGTWPSVPKAVINHSLFLLFGFLSVVPVIAGAQSRLMVATLGNQVSVFLGRISFGIYLWHFPVIYIALQLGSAFGVQPTEMYNKVGSVNGVQLMTEVLIGTIILSALTHYLLERPLGRLGAKVTRGGKPTAFV